MAVIIEDGRLTLTGYVGESTWQIDGWVIFDGFTHAEIVMALGEIGPDADLTVHINSGGGIATEGTAIRAALSDRTGRTDIVIDGIAASAASIIAMGGDTVSMSEGALMMIHDPSGGTWGTVEDHKKTIKGLDSLGNTYARVYARKSGKSDKECRDIMRAETWFTPEEAVAAGFVDEVLGGEMTAVAPFPYQNYVHAPRDLVATAKNNNWRIPAPVALAMANKQPLNSTSKHKETPKMATTPDPAAQPLPTVPAVASVPTFTAADVKTRIKAITESPAAAGNQALAKHLAFETEMSAADAIATLTASATDAPKASADAADPAAYQAGRSAASALAQPGGGAPAPKAKASIDTRGIYARMNKKGA